jgi:hypothetical protein
MAAGTAQRAAIDAAMPIATADAGTYASAGLSAQNATQESGLMGQKFNYDSAINTQNIQANIGLAGMKAENDQIMANQKALADLNIQGANNLAAMDRIVKTGIDSKNAAALLATADANKLDAQTKVAYTTAAAPVLQESTRAIQAIQTSPDSQWRDPAVDKQKAITAITAQKEMDIESLASLYKYPVDWNGSTAQADNAANIANQQATDAAGYADLSEGGENTKYKTILDDGKWWTPAGEAARKG